MKNTITTITLAIVMTFSTTLANAGIMVSDKAAPAPCADSTKDGILVGGRSLLMDGIRLAIAFKTGILVGGRTNPETCTQSKDGILVGG